jgi:hypothetical protein
MKTTLSVCIILIASLSLYSQETISPADTALKVVPFNRIIKPMTLYMSAEPKDVVDSINCLPNPMYDSTLAADIIIGKDSFTFSYKKRGNPNIPWQDCSLLIQLSPYHADSVFVGHGLSEAFTKWHTYFILCGKHEYWARIETKKTLKIQRILGNLIKPNVTLFDKHLPDCSFRQFQGKRDAFSNYLHKGKYIYVQFWSSVDRSEENYKGQRLLSRLYNKYHEQISLISFDCDNCDGWDSIYTHHLLSDSNYIWTQAMPTSKISESFYHNPFPYGFLYDSNGNFLKMDVTPAYLEEFLDEKIAKKN